MFRSSLDSCAVGVTAQGAPRYAVHMRKGEDSAGSGGVDEEEMGGGEYVVTYWDMEVDMVPASQE